MLNLSATSAGTAVAAPKLTRMAAEHGLQEAERNFKAAHSTANVSTMLSYQTLSMAIGFLLILLLLLFCRRSGRRDEAAAHGEDGKSPSKPRRALAYMVRLRSWSLSLLRLLTKPFAARGLSSYGLSSWVRGGSAGSEKQDDDLAKAIDGVEMADMKRTAEIHAEHLRERLGLPMMLGSQSQPPTLLSNSAVLELRRQLPLRLTQSDWALLYSTEQHGCSLRTLYSKMAGNTGTLLVVLDAEGHIFGAFVSDTWRPDKTYFGNGETFLFKVHPHFARYDWTKANSHFVLAAHDCIAFGGGGKFGLWLDPSLEFGSSDTSATFGNDCLAGSTDFKCMKLEVWGFV